MIFDSLGLPRDAGASDLQDSSRLAGIMELFNYPKYVSMDKYVVDDNFIWKYVRHPLEYKYDFSRDQTLCLWSGLWRQKRYDLVDVKFVNGKDWFSPAHRGHEARCKNKKATWFQGFFLSLETKYAAHFKKMDEPNQLLAMIYVAYLRGEKQYLQYWLKHNEKWKEAITEYWCGWRGEKELAEHMIKVLQTA